MDISSVSSDCNESIDFGGRFARQFFQNWTTSTPVASDNSVCDSAYESFGKPQSSLIDKNNNVNQTATNTPTCNALTLRSTPIDKIFDKKISILFPDLVKPQRSQSLFASPSSFITSNNPWARQDVIPFIDTVERAALMHRSAASYSEPQYTWSGQLPSRCYKNPVYSCKVFLGGVPWDVTEQGLIESFGKFGPLKVQWPGKENQEPQQNCGQKKVGYVYLIYESERYVKSLLQACTQDFGSGSYPEKYYYQLSSRRMRDKEVQVIPWCLADSNYVRCQSNRPDINKTVFVGALHGMLTAEGLAKIMNDLFGGVVSVGIDSDKHKYPLGSGRCQFNNLRSYTKAVAAGFIEIKSSLFNKKIQVDPYLTPSVCSTCHVQSTPLFCRDCLRYFCKPCWNWNHPLSDSLITKQHHPMIRKKRES